MNPSPSNPREPMEVRIVAFLLGEASPFEAAEIQAAMAGDPQLAAFHDQMKRTIGLVEETTTRFKPAAQPPPKLSPERREKLLQTFKVIAPKELAPPRVRLSRWEYALRVAAVVAIVGLVVAIAIPNFTKARNSLRMMENLGGEAETDSSRHWQKSTEAAEQSLHRNAKEFAKLSSPAKSASPPPPVAPTVVPALPSAAANPSGTFPSPGLSPDIGLQPGTAPVYGKRVLSTKPPAATTPLTITVAATESSPKSTRQPVFLPPQLADADGDGRKMVELFDNADAPVARQNTETENRTFNNFNGGTLVVNNRSDVPPALTYQWGEQPAPTPVKPSVPAPVTTTWALEELSDAISPSRDSVGKLLGEKPVAATVAAAPVTRSYSTLANVVASSAALAVPPPVTPPETQPTRLNRINPDTSLDIVNGVASKSFGLTQAGGGQSGNALGRGGSGRYGGAANNQEEATYATVQIAGGAVGSTVQPVPAGVPQSRAGAYHYDAILPTTPVAVALPASGPASPSVLAPLPLKLPMPSFKGTPDDLPKSAISGRDPGERSAPLAEAAPRDQGIDPNSIAEKAYSQQPAAGLVQAGRLRYENGQLSEAQAKLGPAAALDPQNKAATYYGELATSHRYALESGRREVTDKQMLGAETDSAKQSGQPFAAYGLPPATPAAADGSERLSRRSDEIDTKTSSNEGLEKPAPELGFQAGNGIVAVDGRGGLGGGGGPLARSESRRKTVGGGSRFSALGLDSDTVVANPEPADAPARPVGGADDFFGATVTASDRGVTAVDGEGREERSQVQHGAFVTGKPASSATPPPAKFYRMLDGASSAVTGPAAAEPAPRAGGQRQPAGQLARVAADFDDNGRVDGHGTHAAGTLAGGDTVTLESANRYQGGTTIAGGLVNRIEPAVSSIASEAPAANTWDVNKNVQPTEDLFALGDLSARSLGRAGTDASGQPPTAEAKKLAKLETSGESTRSRGGESLAWFAKQAEQGRGEVRQQQPDEKAGAKAAVDYFTTFDADGLVSEVPTGKRTAGTLAKDGAERVESLKEVEFESVSAETKPVAAVKPAEVARIQVSGQTATLHGYAPELSRLNAGKERNASASLRGFYDDNASGKDSAKRELAQIALPQGAAEVAKNESVEGDLKIPARYALATDISSTLAALGNAPTVIGNANPSDNHLTTGLRNESSTDLAYRAPQPSTKYRLTQKAEGEAKTEQLPALQVAAPTTRAIELGQEVTVLQQQRENLNMQVIAQEIDSKIPKSMIVEVVDFAEPQQVKSSALRGWFGGDKYESTTRIQVEKDSPDGTALVGDRAYSGGNAYDPYWLQTEFEKIQSKNVLGKVIERLNLNETWAGKYGKDKLSTEETYQLLKKKLDVRQSKGTSLVEIGVRSDKPSEAAQIANKIAEVYGEIRRQRRQEVTASGIDVLKAQWTEQDKKLKVKQAELAQLEQQLGSAPAATNQIKVATPAESDRPVARPSTPPATPQPEILTRENAFSTFSLNVSDVSFKLAAASLQNGVIPDPGSIRVEEFVNAFHYRDPAPAPGARLAFAWERARYPFAHNRDILRLGVQTAARGREAQKPLNLVIALDNSGSMERPDRVAILREALKVLAAQLRPQDRISVIAFSRTARLWVDGMAGGNVQEFLGKVLDLNPEGGTNLEDAMNLAYATATKHFMAQGVNRVILLTDGAANLGNVEPEDLKKQVVAQRQRGIALDCFGIGWEGYDDDFLEILSRNGDGRYGFLNEPEQAGPEFADQLAGALNVAAADVKTQVEFNPQRVTSWRQIGYAKHQLKKEQFRDNTVDAAEIAAAEQGNALYVIETNPNGTGPIGVVRVRFKVPETGDYIEQEWPLAYVPRVPALDQSSPAMRLAVTASAFGEWLSTSPFAAEVKLPALQATLAGVPQVFAPDPRPQQLATMLQQARTLAGK